MRVIINVRLLDTTSYEIDRQRKEVRPTFAQEEAERGINTDRTTNKRRH